MYQTGIGVQKNKSKAMYWFGHAAINNNASACCQLAKMYETRDGVPINLKRTKEWYEKATILDYEKAKSCLIETKNFK